MSIHQWRSQLNWSEEQTERFATARFRSVTGAQPGLQTGLETSAYLSQGALYPTQEVIVAGSDAVSAVDVVDFEPELLHLLEVVVQWKDLGKHRVQVALYDFCPVQLGEQRQEKRVFFTHETVQEPPAASRGEPVHLKDTEHCGLICKNFFGLRHLISASRKAALLYLIAWQEELSFSRSSRCGISLMHVYALPNFSQEQINPP